MFGLRTRYRVGIALRRQLCKQHTNVVFQSRRSRSTWSDFWHLRENFVLSNHERTHQVAVVIGHIGYFVGLLEYGVTDMVWLRVFAIVGCGMVVVYQLLQPRVQWLTAGWCGIYVAINVFQLARLVGANPALSWEEAALYALLGSGSSMTAEQFLAIMSLGEWLWLVDGAVLAEPGWRSDEQCLYFIMAGTCEVCVAGRKVAELGPGDVVGEIGKLSSLGHSRAVVTALGSVRCFAVPSMKVQELVDQEQPNIELRAPLQKVFASSLARKVSVMNEQAAGRNYQAVLEVACTMDELGGIEELSRKLGEYRRRHAISRELHDRLIAQVPQCVRDPSSWSGGS